ncbi:MAG: hypothetical protein NTY70_12260, partial [Burkholderiales bacterium]|nr:hypothetical protein [Burkholderiales bacterium]
RWRHAAFALLWLALVYISVVAVRLLARARPVVAPFSCFVKKRKQKRPGHLNDPGLFLRF